MEQFNEFRNALIGKVAEFAIGGSIDGDYYEFGVFDGNSLKHAYNAFMLANQSVIEQYGFVMAPEAKEWVHTRWRNMHFFGFDSFEGLPDVQGLDVGGAFKKGDYSCPMDFVMKQIEDGGIDRSKVSLIKGWFKDSFNDAFIHSRNGRKAAVIHIDCDLYESTRDVLTVIPPLVQDGTIIIFDDWFQFRGNPMKGEQRAFQEFLDANALFTATEYHREGIWRNSFIININENKEV